MERYEPQAIERKWQAVWERERAFAVPNPELPVAAADATHIRPRDAALPLGRAPHGARINYTLGDVVAHIRRRGGSRSCARWATTPSASRRRTPRSGRGVTRVDDRDEHRRHPRAGARMGWAIDWERELSTHDPDYYRWTQWLFLKFFEAGLAYRKEAPVKWCPNDQTVLANEQVIDGRCERCGAEVESRMPRAVVLPDHGVRRSPARGDGAARSWPERVLAMQRNWIGRSEGAEVVFRIEDLDIDIPVFTTRPDTLFGATFFVLAPEHPLVGELVQGTEREQEVLDYVRHAGAQSAVERADPGREKSGVFTGRTVVNPVSGEEIPVWVADYVLMEYGTGAIMAVPGHDERDFEFAQRFGARGRQVVRAAAELPVDLPFVGKSEPRRARSTRRSSPGCEPRGRRKGDHRAGSRSRVEGRQRSDTACATGSSRGSATGAARSRSSTARGAGSSRSRRPTCPSCFPSSTTTCRKGARRLPRQRTGSGPSAPLQRAGQARDGHDGHLRRLVLVLPALLRSPLRRPLRSIARSATTGRPSTSTSAGSSTRSCTCSTRASSRR